MITNQDRAEIMKIIRQTKDEIRRELGRDTNDGFEDRQKIKSDGAITFVTLAENGSIDEVTAAEHTEMFAEWAIGINYVVGNIRREGDNLYKCLQAHTSQEGWEPSVAVSLWKKIGDPTVEYPEWSQPVGAGDAYNTGDKVSHNDKHWHSSIDNNVWEPGVYGWEED